MENIEPSVELLVSIFLEYEVSRKYAVRIYETVKKMEREELFGNMYHPYQFARFALIDNRKDPPISNMVDIYVDSEYIFLSKKTFRSFF